MIWPAPNARRAASAVAAAREAAAPASSPWVCSKAMLALSARAPPTAPARLAWYCAASWARLADATAMVPRLRLNSGNVSVTCGPAE